MGKNKNTVRYLYIGEGVQVSVTRNATFNYWSVFIKPGNIKFKFSYQIKSVILGEVVAWQKMEADKALLLFRNFLNIGGFFVNILVSHFVNINSGIH